VPVVHHSSPKHGCGFEHHDPANAEKARDDHDQHNAAACQHDVLPHQNEAARRDEAQRHFKERGRHASTQTESHHPYGEGLEQHHADQAPVGDTDGLEGTELFEILEGEQIKGLTGDHRSHDEGDRDSDPEVHGYTRVLQVVPNAVPPEFVRCSSTSASLCVNSLGNLLRTDSGPRSHQHVGQIACAHAQRNSRPRGIGHVRPHS